jgi:hypothetical protein
MCGGVEDGRSRVAVGLGGERTVSHVWGDIAGGEGAFALSGLRRGPLSTSSSGPRSFLYCAVNVHSRHSLLTSALDNRASRPLTTSALNNHIEHPPSTSTTHTQI